MAKLVNPLPDSVILDPTCGDGNLLVACHQGQLVGIEQDPYLYPICRRNLPETAHLYRGDCFKYEDVIRGHKPTIGLLNPPYSTQGTESQSYAFLAYLLDCLRPEGTAIALVPTSCGTAQHSYTDRPVLGGDAISHEIDRFPV
jgi:predicted RNA methylase